VKDVIEKVMAVSVTTADKRIFAMIAASAIRDSVFKNEEKGKWLSPKYVSG
jgi:hypothetical protein